MAVAASGPAGQRRSLSLSRCELLILFIWSLFVMECKAVPVVVGELMEQPLLALNTHAHQQIFFKNKQ